jgi:predicted ester cyclase
MPDAKGDLELTLVNGKNVVAVALFTGTQSGPLASPSGTIPPTNKKAGFRVAHMVHMSDDGNVADKQMFYEDFGTLLGQLGVSKAPARPVADKPAPAQVVVAKDDDTEKRNLETIAKVTDAFNKHDMKAFDALVGDNLMWSEIGMTSDWNKKQTIEGHEGLFKAFSDLKLTPSSTWAAGDYVVEQGVIAGTNDGDMPAMKLKKTGKPVSLNYLQVYKLDKDGKVTASWGFWNSAAFAQQLGLVPPPAKK